MRIKLLKLTARDHVSGCHDDDDGYVINFADKY